MAKTIRQRIEEIHQNALDHGWWDREETAKDRHAKLPEKILLAHCELSEATECFRTGDMETTTDPDTGKPEGFWVEIADCVIRLFDLAGASNVDLEHLIEQKHNYNKTRSFRHGNKVI